jgi:hypothetical protein
LQCCRDYLQLTLAAGQTIPSRRVSRAFDSTYGSRRDKQRITHFQIIALRGMLVVADLPIRVVAFFAGLVLTAFFLKSVSSTVLVNRLHGHWLARRIDKLAYALVVSVGSRRRTYNAAQEALAWLLPIYMLLLIVAWFLLAQVGFSLIIWSVQAEHSIGRALIASGSALSTLGFMTPPEVSGQILAILEGAIGLGIVVFFFTFIPGYQSAVQVREARTAWLYARTGEQPAGYAFLNWAYDDGVSKDLTSLWDCWEDWFRLLIETHTVTPILAFVPSIHRGQSWLVAAIAVLDAASFSVAALDTSGRASARVCHTTGVGALKLLSERHYGRSESGPVHPVSRIAFDAACERMAALNIPLKSDRDKSWQRFVALRSEYDKYLPGLARSLLLPPRLLAGYPTAGCSGSGNYDGDRAGTSLRADIS